MADEKTTESVKFKKPLKIKKQKKTEIRPWADLPEDLLRIITQKFYIHDLVRLRLVCKDWRARTKGFEPAAVSPLPWIFQYKWVNKKKNTEAKLKGELSDPISKSRFTFEYDDSWMLRKMSLLGGANPCASKHGWLLFVKSISSKGTSFFVCNPFLNELKLLPLLSTISDSHCLVAAFSKDPSCPDCVVYVLHRFGLPPEMATYSFGDKKWRTVQTVVQGEIVDRESVDSMVYSDEKDELYCLFSGGMLAKFDAIDRHWSVMLNQKHQRVTPKTLMEYKGQLVAVTGKDRRSGKMHVYRFDWSRMDWIVIDSFGSDAIPPDFYSSSTLGEKVSSLIYNCKNEARNADILARISYLSLKAQELCTTTDFYSISYEPIRGGSCIAWVQPPQSLRKLGDWE